MLLEELFVAERDSLCHVLQGLGTELLEITEPWKLADFRQVLLELVLVQALMEQTVVPVFMEGDAMIVPGRDQHANL